MCHKTKPNQQKQHIIAEYDKSNTIKKLLENKVIPN